MPAPDSSSDYDVHPRLLALARLVGMSEITARWKIIRLQRQWRRFRQDLAPASRRFDRQLCQACGALQAKGNGRCTACGERVGSALGATLRAAGLSIPTALSVSTGLAVVMLAIYARMMIARPGQGYLGWDHDTLIAFGAHYPPLVHAGQWWRLGTAMFLHIGLWHLGFNLLALAQIGPTIEDLFGRGRMLAFFLVTGVVANLGSEALGLTAVSAGASGAIMGLIGIAAGWGQRAGTTQGRTVRNDMLKWAAYTMVFGYVIHADNAAHAAGFAAGAVLGLAHSPFGLERGKRGTVNAVLGLLGVLGTGSLAFLCLFPPAGAAQVERAESEDDDYDSVGLEQLPMLLELLGGEAGDGLAADGPACALLAQGNTTEALVRFRADDPASQPDGGTAAGPQLEVVCETRAVRAAICAGLESEEYAAAVGRKAVPAARAQDALTQKLRARCLGYRVP